MNKRIRELAEDCTVDFVDGRGVAMSEIDVEKFAELIVKECANWINDNVGLVDEQARVDLLKHFGVEE